MGFLSNACKKFSHSALVINQKKNRRKKEGGREERGKKEGKRHFLAIYSLMLLALFQ